VRKKDEFQVVILADSWNRDDDIASEKIGLLESSKY
jgi:hypothetical protein